MKYQHAFIPLAFFILPIAFAGGTQDSFCGNPDVAVLTDRGSVTDTPCVVPKKKLLVEGGYQYQNLIRGANLSNVPQVQISLGLPRDTEVFLDLPSYNALHPILNGIGPTSIGGKAEFISSKKWGISGQGLAILPSGSNNFGNDGTGVVINAIGAYALNSQFTLASMLGASSVVEPFAAGSNRFNSFNYTLSLAYTPIEKVNFFAELFGQTKTSSDDGHGFDGNIGLIYAYNKSVAFDVEFSQRLSGALGGFQHSIGAGVTVFLV